MTQASLAARWWAVPPPLQVSHLAGVDPALLSVDLDPLPDGCPAVVQLRPGAALPPNDLIPVLLAELDRACVALFPRWLPGAERIEGPQGHGVAAVRALASEAAARSPNFGPFLTDLAERALRAQAAREPTPNDRGPREPDPSDRDPREPDPDDRESEIDGSRFAAEVRAAGLTRVLADAYGREHAALLIHLPGGLRPAAEAALTHSAEWLAGRGRIAVWLAGAPLHTVDRIRSVRIRLPRYLTDLDRETPPPDGDPPRVPVFSYPPLSGGPRRDSPAELALERALAPHDWARGRRWNHTYDWHVLGRRYRLDLFWTAERIVVEVDGPEHRERLRFAEDRRRDVQLQLLGHAVLRFTNDQVLSDVQAVVHKIRQLLADRRAHPQYPEEKRTHVDR